MQLKIAYLQEKIYMTQFSDEIKKLIDNTPNDQTLGEKIRALHLEEKDRIIREGLDLDGWRKGTLWEKKDDTI